MVPRLARLERWGNQERSWGIPHSSRSGAASSWEVPPDNRERLAPSFLRELYRRDYPSLFEAYGRASDDSLRAEHEELAEEVDAFLHQEDLAPAEEVSSSSSESHGVDSEAETVCSSVPDFIYRGNSRSP